DTLEGRAWIQPGIGRCERGFGGEKGGHEQGDQGNQGLHETGVYP
ncbi:MAG: hypothetical protein RL412_888, partial [Pseudomonadota bacterium]